MASVSIKEQTEYLVQLQVIDTQIYSAIKKLEMIPREIEKKIKEFEVQRASLNALEEKNKALLLKKKEKELELASKEENIKKLQTQLFSIKTNKEYTAMLKEIDGAKADKSMLEDQILSFLEELDVLNAAVTKEKNHLRQEEDNFARQKSALEEERKFIEQEQLTLAHKRAQIIPNIDKNILSAYERILKSRGGLALAKVVNNACQGCFMNVTHQKVNEIRMHENLIICESCARILYEEEERSS